MIFGALLKKVSPNLSVVKGKDSGLVVLFANVVKKIANVVKDLPVDP